MSKTLVIFGFGTGISAAVAEKFGVQGFAVAVVARSEERLAADVSALSAKGVTAASSPPTRATLSRFAASWRRFALGAKAG